MMIRFATLADVDACVAIGRRMHALTRFQAYDYDAARVAQQLRAVIETGQNQRGSHCFLVAERAVGFGDGTSAQDDAGPSDEARAPDHGRLIGALIGCIEQHFFSVQSVASVVHYDVLPEYRMSGAGFKLLIALRRWAENRGAYELSVGINSGVDLERLDRFLRRLGFRQTGANYAMTLGRGSA